MIARVDLLGKFSGNVERARENFLKDYRYAHDDKERVDGEIVKRFKSAKDARADEVTLPIELVIAITLHEGFGRAGGHPDKSDWEQRKLESAIRHAWLLTKKYREERLSRREARERAIKEAASAESGGVPESVLRDQMGRKKYNHLKS